jgi:subtilisin family serine protease
MMRNVGKPVYDVFHLAWGRVLLRGLLALCMLFFGPVWAGQPVPTTAAPAFMTTETAGPDTPGIPADMVVQNLARVQALVSKHGQVDVIVYLRLPDISAQEPSRHMDQIGALQASVLNDLSDSEFFLHRKFEMTPGFSGKVTAAGLRKLSNRSDVLMVYEDQRVQADLKESVPLINADDVQALGIRGEGVTVAVLDSGIDTDHPALADDLLGQKCFTHSACPPGKTSTSDSAEDDEGHGTSVAGIITSSGVVPGMPALGPGVAPDAGIVAVKVLDNTGSGYLSDWISAMEWVNANQAAYNIRVVNISLGSAELYSSVCDSSQPNLNDLVNIAVSKGIVLFAASGNSASSISMSAPACLSKVISVGAVYDANVGGLIYSNCSDSSTYADKVTCFSNVNSMLDVLAPSNRTITTGLGGIEYSFGGTSAASPHAAGVAALLLTSEPDLTPAAIEQRLKSTGKSINVSRGAYSYTFPRIDALAAFLAGGDPYEADDSFPQAKTMIDGEPQTHSIIPAGDVDYVKFTLNSTSAVQLETSGATSGDTYMWLYNSSQTLIAEDDNSGDGNYSRILRTCTEGSWLLAGTYYVKVNNVYDYSEIPAYNISYLRTQTCTNAPQEVDVRYTANGTSISDGDNTPSFMDGTYFGMAEVTGSTRRAFSVWNIGGADLILSGSPKVAIGGVNAADFSVEVQPTSPVPAGDHSVQFMVKFTPSDTGVRTATITITSNDTDEDVYTFTVEGLGVTTLLNLYMPAIRR